MTCLVYGLTTSIIREDTNIRRALSTLVAQGPFLFADIEEIGGALERRVILEIAQMKEGRGDALVDKLMDWVRWVQIRAL